jgi:hypothetical protein
MSSERRRFLFLRRETGDAVEIQPAGPHASDSLLAAVEALDCPDCLFDVSFIALQRLSVMASNGRLDPYVAGMVEAAFMTLSSASDLHFGPDGNPEADTPEAET